MLTSPKIFLLMKSESAPYVKHIEPVLAKNELEIESLYYITDWTPLAQELYKQRIESASNAFKAGFEGHLWLSSFLFGQKAILAILKSATQKLDLEYLARQANSAKENFRESLPQTRDGTIIMTMNIELIDKLKIRDGGVAGYLGVKQLNDTFSPFEIGGKGLWDFFYLKYIHVPSPNLIEIQYEWSALEKFGILNQENQLSAADWKNILNLGAFFHPRLLLSDCFNKE